MSSEVQPRDRNEFGRSDAFPSNPKSGSTPFNIVICAWELYNSSDWRDIVEVLQRMLPLHFPNARILWSTPAAAFSFYEDPDRKIEIGFTVRTVGSNNLFNRIFCYAQLYSSSCLSVQ
jgi:hypothetical protein